MATGKVARRAVVADLTLILDSPEVASLIAAVSALRDPRGQKGYGARALIGACLIKTLYALPTWTRVAALIAEHPGLQDALGGVPSCWACYRFTVKLRANQPVLADCLDRLIAALQEALPEYGIDVAIDATDAPAFANGQRFAYNNGPERERYSDPDASWGHRSAVSTRAAGSFYGFKLHAAVCTRTGLPVAWQMETARRNESLYVAPLLDAAAARGIRPATVAADKGYDNNRVMNEVRERGAVPIICVRKGRPIPLTAIPYRSDEWKRLYRGRAAVERTFAALKLEYGFAPLRVRGIDRVRLHADLVMVGRLSQALIRAREVVGEAQVGA